MILFFNTSRRIDLFVKTLDSFVEKNKPCLNLITHVYILDHISTYKDRKLMVDLCRLHFGSKVTLYEFNSSSGYDYVDKLNSIGHIVNEDDYVFFVEDDWVSINQIDIKKCIENLEIVDFINFATPLHIQDENTVSNYKINDYFWKNPFPDFFKHPLKMLENGDLFWNMVRMNNFSLTPHITKGKSYKTIPFEKNKNYEISFADKNNFKQYFTNKLYFKHIGFDRSFESKN